jgi:hypothetical protein
VWYCGSRNLTQQLKARSAARAAKEERRKKQRWEDLGRITKGRILKERTYGALLARLGSEPAVGPECLFADPIADIAVLGSPDDQAMCDEAEAYETLVESATPIAIADAPEKSRGWLLSLEGKWFRCTLEYIDDGRLWITNTAQPIVGGMSGSPVISDRRAAIGIVALANAQGCEDQNGSRNPRLVRDLPGWLLHSQL